MDERELMQRIYEWLPKRRSLQRLTGPDLCAYGLGVPVELVRPVWQQMVREGHIVTSPRKQRMCHYQGIPIPVVSAGFVDVPLWSEG